MERDGKSRWMARPRLSLVFDNLLLYYLIVAFRNTSRGDTFIIIIPYLRAMLLQIFEIPRDTFIILISERYLSLSSCYASPDFIYENHRCNFILQIRIWYIFDYTISFSTSHIRKVSEKEDRKRVRFSRAWRLLKNNREPVGLLSSRQPIWLIRCNKLWTPLICISHHHHISALICYLCATNRIRPSRLATLPPLARCARSLPLFHIISDTN